MSCFQYGVGSNYLISTRQSPICTPATEVLFTRVIRKSACASYKIISIVYGADPLLLTDLVCSAFALYTLYFNYCFDFLHRTNTHTRSCYTIKGLDEIYRNIITKRKETILLYFSPPFLIYCFQSVHAPCEPFLFGSAVVSAKRRSFFFHLPFPVCYFLLPFWCDV